MKKYTHPRHFYFPEPIKNLSNVENFLINSEHTNLILACDRTGT